jgi:hypothetical protein
MALNNKDLVVLHKNCGNKKKYRITAQQSTPASPKRKEKEKNMSWH